MSEDKQTLSPQKKSLKSEVVKSGKITYFLDVFLTQKGDKYLKITESKFVGEKQPRQRNNIFVFSQNIESFKSAIIKLCENI